MKPSSVSVENRSDGLLVTGMEKNDWKCEYSDDHYLLLRATSLGEKGNVDGFSLMTQQLLSPYLRGLISEYFSGQVCFQFPGNEVQKTLYLRNGRIVFASSSLIDDRLGEVVYRLGLISLEEMMESAVQVTKVKKFGKVLIENGIFSHTDLWNALKSQTLWIFRSLFFHSEVYVKTESETVETRSKVNFQEDTSELLENAAAYGQMLIHFNERISSETTIYLEKINSSAHDETSARGTFSSDMVGLVQNTPNMRQLLSKSNLLALTTLQAIFDLMNSGIVRVENLKPPAPIDRSAHNVRELRNILDTYNVLLTSSRQVFQKAGVAFPVSELESFLSTALDRITIPLYIDPNGSIADESVRSLFAACKQSSKMQEKVVLIIEALIQFVLQVATDSLEDRGAELKRLLDEMRV